MRIQHAGPRGAHAGIENLAFQRRRVDLDGDVDPAFVELERYATDGSEQVMGFALEHDAAAHQAFDAHGNQVGLPDRELAAGIARHQEGSLWLAIDGDGREKLRCRSGGGPEGRIGSSLGRGQEGFPSGRDFRTRLTLGLHGIRGKHPEGDAEDDAGEQSLSARCRAPACRAYHCRRNFCPRPSWHWRSLGPCARCRR